MEKKVTINAQWEIDVINSRYSRSITIRFFFVPLSLDSAKREHLRWIRNHWEMLMLYKKKKEKKRLKAVTSDICKSGRRLSLPPWIPRIRPWKNWISDSRSRPLPCRGILNNVVGSMKSRIAATKNYSAFSFIHSSFFFFLYPFSESRSIKEGRKKRSNEHYFISTVRDQKIGNDSIECESRIIKLRNCCTLFC